MPLRTRSRCDPSTPPPPAPSAASPLPCAARPSGSRCGRWSSAAEFAALVPVIFPGEEQVEAVQVIYRLIGGSFAACGLIAWRRRPDSRSGQLMAMAGVGFFLSAIISQFHPPVAQTAAILLQELWAPFFVALLLTLLTGGRLETRVDWLLVGAFVLALCGSCRWSGCCSTSRTATSWPSSRTPTSPTRSTRASARWPASPASRSRWWSRRAGARRRARGGARCCRASPAARPCCSSRRC